VSSGTRARLAALLALALAPAGLHAQRLQYVGGGIGVVVPAGSFGDVDKAGWHLSGLGIGRLKGSVHFVVDVLYGRTGHQGGVSGSSTLAGGTLSAALFVGSDGRRVRPFVSAGAGVFRANVGVVGFGSAAATKFAPAAGAGVLVGTGRRRAFLLARYVSVGTKPQTTSFMPISAGVILTLGSP
jgi:hypothetical protein